MDANKLKVLREVGYQIPGVCGLCRHGAFPKNNWGTCNVTTYSHQKHTGDDRQLSIHKFGSCPKFDADPNAVFGLLAFSEFLDSGET